MQIKICRISENQRDDCLNLIIACLRTINVRSYSKSFIEQLVDKYQIYFLKQTDIDTFIVVQHNKILGCGSIGKNGQIRDVFVDIHHQRKGIGRKIIEYLEEQAKLNKISSVFLYAAINAVGFYARLGYVEKERIIHDGENIEIKMEKMI